MKLWNKIVVNVASAEQKEIISALFMHFGAESVVDLDSSLEVYVDRLGCDEILERVKDMDLISDKGVKVLEIENQNWNALWESKFDPIKINDITIRADFHPKVEGRQILISPKMAFGTGHHNTTFMMIEAMDNSNNFSGKNVLDYGCGTGILAVFSIMKNADHVTCIDIQSEAVENTIEHFKLNSVGDENFAVIEGDLDVLESDIKYDVILANINRHVLLNNVLKIYEVVKTKGQLFMSGILIEDRTLILESYSVYFDLIAETQKGEWCFFKMQKKNL